MTPEIIEAVEIERDGEKVILRGYVNSRRCPSRIKAQTISIVNQHRAFSEDGFDFGAHLTQVREFLLAVVIGLEDDEADMLAADDGDTGGGAVLRLLKWWDDAPAGAAEDDADPEATAGKSTTANSSPTSLPATEITTG